MTGGIADPQSWTTTGFPGIFWF